MQFGIAGLDWVGVVNGMGRQEDIITLAVVAVRRQGLRQNLFSKLNPDGICESLAGRGQLVSRDPMRQPVNKEPLYVIPSVIPSVILT